MGNLLEILALVEEQYLNGYYGKQVTKISNIAYVYVD
jgi:hypothetical protein